LNKRVWGNVAVVLMIMASSMKSGYYPGKHPVCPNTKSRKFFFIAQGFGFRIWL
jgi:hypothetical protein